MMTITAPRSAERVEITGSVPWMVRKGWSGQEAGLNKRLRFFEKDTIDFSNLPLEDFYTKLMHLNKDNQALWNGEFGGDLQFITPITDTNSLAYFREKNDDKVLVMLNLSDKKQEIKNVCQLDLTSSATTPSPRTIMLSASLMVPNR